MRKFILIVMVIGYFLLFVGVRCGYVLSFDCDFIVSCGIMVSELIFFVVKSVNC